MTLARFALLFSVPALLFGAGLKIDHVTIAGIDLPKMRAALTAAGIPSQYGGPHANHASEMSLTTFADGSYLELIALQPKGDPQAIAKHEWSVQMRGNAGPGAWAARVGDIDAERKRLQAAAVQVSAPEHSGRARPDGFLLQWETAQVGAETRGTFFPFLIRDITPREQRTGKPLATGLRGVSRVVVATKDLKASIGRFRAAYQWPAPVEQEDAAFGARVAVFAGTPVVLAAPLNPQSWVATRLMRFGEGPCALVFAAEQKTKWKAASSTRWAGSEISWIGIAPVDASALPWHLGIE